MAIDASIPLSANQFNLGQVAQGANQLMALRQNMQQQQAQNALKQLMSDPSNMDPSTGQPTPNALMKIMAIDPPTGMKLQENALTLQADRARLGEIQMKRAGEIQGMVEPVRDSALNAYEDTLKATGDRSAAQAAGQRALDDGLAPIRSGGLLSDAEKQQLRSKFDYGQMRTQALTYKDRKAAEEKQKADERADKRLKIEDDRAVEQAKRTDALIAAQANKDPTANKWEVLTDPSKKDEAGNPIQYRYNPAKAEATTLDGKPYSPGGASRIAGGGQPRSGPAMAIRKYIEEHPEATSDDIAREVAREKALTAETVIQGTAESKADAASLTKLVPQKNAIEAFENTAIKNGDILVDLAKKVDKTGVPVVERWIRAGRQATGDADIAKFNAQMFLYRSEVAKILTNPNLTGVLSDSARNEVEEFLKGNASASQIEAVHNLLKGDFGRRRESIDEQIAKVKDDIKKGGPSKTEGKSDTPVTPDYYVPPALKTVKNLQWSSSRKQFRDPDSGTIYDMDGNKVAQ